MKNLRFILLLIIYFSSSNLLFGQWSDGDYDYKKVISDVKTSFSEFSDKASTTFNNKTLNRDVYNQLDQLDTEIRKLRKTIKKCYYYDYELDSVFFFSLTNSITAMSQIKAEDTAAFVPLLSSLIKDYQLKNASRPAGGKTLLISNINVIVKSNGGEGYHVKCRNTYEPRFVNSYIFNNPTNNASRSMAPGYYVVWLEKGEFKSEERYIELESIDLNHKENIIFNVP